MEVVRFMCFAGTLSFALASSSCRCLGRPGPSSGSAGSPTGGLGFGTPISCGLDAQCQAIDPNSTCYIDECLCILGYHLSATGSCIRECDTYGTTYIKYIGVGIDSCTANIPAAAAQNVSACQALCDADVNCISFDFNSDGNTCTYHYCDPLDDPLNTGGEVSTVVVETVDLYVKNCFVGN